MFQNINPEFEDIEESEFKSDKNVKFNETIRELFKIQNIIYYILCFGVSMMSFGEGISPFGLAILAATCSNKMPVGIVYIVCAIGSFCGQGKEGLLIYILTTLVFITFSLIYRPKFENIVRNEKKKLGTHLVISTILVQAMGITFKTFYVYDLLTSILFTIVTYIFYKIFTNSITVIKDYGQKTAFTIEEVMGASLFLAIAVTVLGNFTVFGFSIKNILCILIVLVLGWKNGILVGATGGITIGVVLGIIGKGEPALIAAFALSGMIAGILNRFGKIGVVIGFLIGNIILTYVATGNVEQIIYFREVLIASIGLLLVPKSIDINITDLVGKTKFLPLSRERMLEENEDTIYKLNSVSETISEISKSYGEAAATIVEEDELIKAREKQKENFIDELLDGMENEENNMLYEDIINVDNGIASDIHMRLQEKETLYMQDIIEIFEKHNSYIVGLSDEDIRDHVEKDIMQVVKISNHAAKISNLNFAWKKRMEDSKKTISIGLDSVSKVISNVAETISEKNNGNYQKEKEEIEILLLQKNIGVYDINITKQKNGKIVVDLYTKVKEDLTEEVTKIQKVESILLKVFEEKMIMQKQKNNIGGEEKKVLQTYVSEDKYTMTVGIANRTKQGSETNGDSSLKIKLEDGKMLLALSDGMGSGKEANKSSETAIKMIKNLMRAGFEKESALELINTSIAMKAENETFATLDISIFDLYTGNMEVLKNGACPTYIKRGKEIKTIHAISLPAGILNNIDSVVFDADIKPGDIVVMCTDGIIEANREAINKEEAFGQFLQKINTDNPQKIADIIVKEAIDYGYGVAKDDMTVIVAKVG